MKYSEGKFGRIFVARLEEGESIYQTVEDIARIEKLNAASVFALGGMKTGKVVTGPQNASGKVIPHYEEFDDAREIVGFGTVFLQEGKPSLHFHAGIGREDKALVGCPRGEMTVFLVLEVVIIELAGVEAERIMDEERGVHLLNIFGLGVKSTTSVK